MTVDDLALEKGIPFLAKKGVLVGRHLASDRDSKLQKKEINYALDKARPVFQKVGSEVLDQLSSEVRPSRGKGFDIYSVIGRLPKPKRGWTLPGHNYTGSYNPLEKQVDHDPETGQIRQIYQQPTRETDAIAMQHDVDYVVCSNRGEGKKCKHKADEKMVKAIYAVPWKDRQWGQQGM